MTIIADHFPGRANLAHTDRRYIAFTALPLDDTMTFKTILFILLNILFSVSRTYAQSTAIGQWQDHLPYRNTIAVALGGGHVYCATTTGVFRYDPSSGEIQRLTKVNALSDVGIQGIKWNEPLGMLVVYYTNGNLDLLQGTNSYNMNDIKRSTILGDKGVYNVHFEGTTAYLSCGFGIVKIDLAGREVQDTWFIGPGGSQVEVNSVAFYGDSIYAATSTGLFSAYSNASNLAAFDNWHKRTDMGSAMSGGPFSDAVSFGGKLLLNFRGPTNNSDTLLVLGDQGVFQPFVQLYGRVNRNLNVSSDGQFLIIPHSGDIHRYNTALDEITSQYGYADSQVRASQAVHGENGIFWVADQQLGLVRGEGYGAGTSILPNGPRHTSVYSLTSSGNAVYVSSGALAGNWTNNFLKDGVYNYVDGNWMSFDRDNTPLMFGENGFGEAVNDVVAVAIDPKDPNHAFAGSWEEGLIEFKDRVPVRIYNIEETTLLEEANSAPNKVDVGGLSYDKQGNLWISNANTTKPVQLFTKDGDWQGFEPGGILNGNNLVGNILAASNGYVWVIRPRGNALLVFDPGTNILDTGDDRFKLLNNIEGSGGLPSQDVYCFAEDKESQIWIGTNKGIAVFYNPTSVFDDEGFDAQQILIEQDGNTQLLLETESISAIEVDGADRKWIGTQTSGAYLISSDGQEQIHHFTAANSPLPSDNIIGIAVNEVTGEVFFGTDRGIMSYRSDAVDGENESDCAKVFPNPVTPAYSGPIAVTGLVRDSEVKITDVSGNLVYRTTSLGGQAIWDGNDMAGARVSTGVYLIFASDRSGSFKCNTKVLVTR